MKNKRNNKDTSKKAVLVGQSPMLNIGGWYEHGVEEPVRDLVKVLRGHGFNTECSCGHEMYVQCQYIPDGEIARLHSLLFCYLHEKKLPINYSFVVRHMVQDGYSISSLDIYFPTSKSAKGHLEVGEKAGFYKSNKE